MYALFHLIVQNFRFENERVGRIPKIPILQKQFQNIANDLETASNLFLFSFADNWLN